MKIHLEECPGDILVFLTGQDEIEHACDKLYESAEKIDYSHDVHYHEVEAMLILPLYGSMTTGLCNFFHLLPLVNFSVMFVDFTIKHICFAELQKRVFDPPSSSVRKVVVATNIAATSLTIEGIR